MFEKKFGLGIMGAAALAACSPADKAPLSPEEVATATASVMLEDKDGTVQILLPQETGGELDVATPEETWAKSGMPSSAEALQEMNTQEDDSMSSEDIAKLQSPE